ncbi:carboxypeptidase regulatory-like domain-containing protein [Aphanothece sacrum]|uniref:Additional component NikL of nickel ECF transporter n=1 Tax=Aphanothece sacrum FPU1 TaxID=1920663 RepID=A0A401ILY4_APHSA|nr:carboxypeptidase regulatory-like domain-containing protein [Aphanothece sacrum]GBF82267.1 additional component NikL of nickel ECF transporter [Aphanothece sacrum FPU1]GBF87195.1 nickel ECF transporter component NikL [Aphanothece sacrum FPU3]
MKKLLVLLPILLGIVAIPTKILAHAVETNYLLSNQLEFQTKYSTGEPLKGAKVMVYAPNNPDKPWMEGKTDEEGRFSFLPDKSIKGDWQVEILQEGHEDYLTVPVDEKGIEVDKISQKDQQDLHYSSSALSPIESLIITAGIGASWFVFLRKKV